ncbi:hypothetical protein OGATHE_004147 [Ogataea polymorpha]|uniref:Uncharacterized protein n=1 Tax=Ogataea polymorpha TaxID=460523 RepID=A0A9P8T4X7_9ASCO|nr:hypothetical protein OGATHE_004147 [Ogataea polymorpha]
MPFKSKGSVFRGSSNPMSSVGVLVSAKYAKNECFVPLCSVLYLDRASTVCRRTSEESPGRAPVSRIFTSVFSTGFTELDLNNWNVSCSNLLVSVYCDFSNISTAAVLWSAGISTRSLK